MRNLFFFLLIIMASCTIRTGYYSVDYSYGDIPTNNQIVVRQRPFYNWFYRPRYFNTFTSPYVYPFTPTYPVVINHHHHHTNKPRTNLPLNNHTGPVGGRRGR